MLVVTASARVVRTWVVGAAPVVVGVWRAVVGGAEGTTRVEAITVVGARNAVVGGAATARVVTGSEDDVGNTLTGVETVVVT